MITFKKHLQQEARHQRTIRSTPAGRHKAAARAAGLRRGELLSFPNGSALRLRGVRPSARLRSGAPAYPACDALNPLRRYESKILALVARIERRPCISAAEPFTYKEARAIYKYHKLGAFFPLAGFADRLNTIAAPVAVMSRDLIGIFRQPFTLSRPLPRAIGGPSIRTISLREAARVQRKNEAHRLANLIKLHKGTTK